MKLDFRLLKEARLTQKLIVLSICLGLVGGILGILQARQVSHVINQVFLEHATLETITNLLLFILIIIVLRAVLAWVGDTLAVTAAHQITQDLRQRLFTQLFSHGPAYLR